MDEKPNPLGQYTAMVKVTKNAIHIFGFIIWLIVGEGEWDLNGFLQLGVKKCEL